VAAFQDFIDRYIWPVKKSWTAGDDIYDTHGNIIHSFYSTDNTAGELVTERNALKNSTIYSSVNVRGNTICSLPIDTIEEKGGQKNKLYDHPTHWVLSREPNAYMTAANFWKTIMLHVDIWGNGYALIKRDSRRNLLSLDIMLPWEVTISWTDNGPYYVHNGESYPASDVLHYRFYSWDGICGRSPVRENSQTIGMAMKLDRYSAILMAAQPPGILHYEGNLTPEAKAENRKEFQSGKVGQVRVLSGRWKYDAIMTPAEDSTFAVQKRQNKTDLLGIWQMPPQFVQDLERSTFSNAEQMDLVYAKHTIVPPCRNIELENNMKLFKQNEKETMYTKFNLNGLLRGDLAARQAFYQAMVNSGIMNRNEARSYEDLNPYEGGEDFLVQGAMVPADMLRQMMESKVIPSAPPVKNKLNGHAHVN
jgi:HK97 family phage portal protein